MKHTTFLLPAEQVAQLEQVAKSKQVNRSIVIRWAIEQYLQSLFLPTSLSEKTNGDNENQTIGTTQQAA